MAKKRSRSSAPKKKAEPEVKVIEKEDLKRTTYKHLKVNFWRTRLHGEELGAFQALKYQAKTRYFGKDFDIEGVVEEDGQKKYIIAYNKDDWKEAPDDKKRLVCRLFTILEDKPSMGSSKEAREAKGGNFKGGFELSITHSLIQSSEVREPAPVFFVQIPNMTYLTKIVKSYRLTGTRWNFPLLPEKKEDKLQVVTAKGKVGLGVDYDIFIGKKKIARIDGQRVQKEWEIDIYDENYAKDKTFVMLLILFGCICNFMKSATKLIEKFYKPMKDTGTTDYKPPKLEMDLFKNPRLMRK